MSVDIRGGSDLTLFRSAFPETKEHLAFGNYRANHGLAAAMPLFKNIKFHWVKGGGNPIGDIMSWNIFSPRAASLIKQFKGEFDIFEPIEIVGIQAFYIAPVKIQCLDDRLDIFNSEKYRKGCVVSLSLKNAWEDAGLLGAEFKPIST